MGPINGVLLYCPQDLPFHRPVASVLCSFIIPTYKFVPGLHDRSFRVLWPETGHGPHTPLEIPTIHYSCPCLPFLYCTFPAAPCLPLPPAFPRYTYIFYHKCPTTHTQEEEEQTPCLPLTHGPDHPGPFLQPLPYSCGDSFLPNQWVNDALHIIYGMDFPMQA